MNDRARRVVDVPSLLSRLGVNVERRGDRLWAPCPHPEHNDDTPSWFMEDQRDNPDEHGHHYCFGCKQGGWPIHLVEWVTGLTGKEAWRWLASAEQHAPARLRAAVVQVPVARVLRLPPEVVQTPLEEWPHAPQRYATERRGLTAEDVLRWRLGYAVRSRSEEEIGLRGRVVIPVYSAAGRLLSYTARAFVKARRKYIEPGKAEGANLGAVFGEQFWPAPAERAVVVVTEGGFDAVAVHRVCELPVAGLYGSGLHPGQVAKLSTWKRVVVATDPDAAGKQAYAALREVLVRYCQLVRVELPEEEDCASLARDRPALLHELVMGAVGRCLA